MARSRRRRPDPRVADDSLDRLIAGWKRSETRRGQEWTVQPVSASQAQKDYTCPGCRGTIAPGTAHLVVWRADGVLGDAADLAARRHWHTRCWNIA
ncbi:hypothetical protein [Microbacterium sp. NPDC057650]|uniref:hypothetical protein n=1 Tax=unclassified Microbacterium TaxID=2609290 RepID=UPI00366E82D2